MDEYTEDEVELARANLEALEAMSTEKLTEWLGSGMLHETNSAIIRAILEKRSAAQ